MKRLNMFVKHIFILRLISLIVCTASFFSCLKKITDSDTLGVHIPPDGPLEVEASWLENSMAIYMDESLASESGTFYVMFEKLNNKTVPLTANFCNILRADVDKNTNSPDYYA